MLKIFKLATLAVSLSLVACGGGGGDGGESDLPYSISMRVEKSQLPINISNVGAGIGAYAPYTTTVYVEAREGDDPIPGGEEIFACNLVQGLDSGALYYLDGDDEHEDDDGNPLAYRSVTLDSNSGAASFHFHSGNQAGIARITCSVQNPASGTISTASADIVVGAATGRPSSVVTATMAPFVLGTQDNTASLRNNVAIQAFLMDDANQPVPNPAGGANLQVSIRSFGAFAGARLISGTQSGGVVQVKTIGGVGLFSLSSGNANGAILLELVTDRFDNDVSNGVQTPVVSLHAVQVNNGVDQVPLQIAEVDSITAVEGMPFAYALALEGGVAPYTWSVVGSLPWGLSLSNDGIINGTVLSSGQYRLVVRVTDARGTVAIRNLTIEVTPRVVEPAPPPPISPLVFTVNGCSAGPGIFCTLPVATAGQYVHSFVASGGDPAEAVKWIFNGEPEWLTGDEDTGVVTGLVPAGDSCERFAVTATRGNLSVTRQVALPVNGGSCT